MRTKINNFWKTFLAVQFDFFIAKKTGNYELGYESYTQLGVAMTEIEEEMGFLIVYVSNKKEKARIYFITRGKVHLKELAALIVSQAPILEAWDFQAGLPAYRGSTTSLWSEFKFFGDDVYVKQVYVSVHNISKTYHKIHLTIYVDMNKSFSKSQLRPVMETFLKVFLGEDDYFRHIGRIRMVRRKFSKINFSPVEELKNLIAYKSVN
ncbi:MAG: hypothetical protein WBA61_16960 [Aequorivita sp.]